MALTTLAQRLTLKCVWRSIEQAISKGIPVRLPVELIWQQEFPTEHEAFACERQVKGWTRAKKEALICRDFNAIHAIVKTERIRREAKKCK
jgi:predicted GIY-YIG superfamily endonuclease